MIPALENLPQDKKIILFDGLCNLCDSSVQFIIRQDTKDIFRFVSLQSELGMQIKTYIGLDNKVMDSILLYEPEIAYFTKSKAVFKIAKNLGGVWVVFVIFELFPAFFTDKIYDYIAKNRYKWYGKKTDCKLINPKLKDKFLDFE